MVQGERKDLVILIMLGLPSSCPYKIGINDLLPIGVLEHFHETR